MPDMVQAGLMLLLHNIWIVPIGVLLGLLVGATPGFSASNSMAIMLPLTLGMGVEQALIFMVAVYVGGEAGGAIPACLLNIPGTGSSAVTCFDGYPMSIKGMPSQALGVAIHGIIYRRVDRSDIALIAAPLMGKFALSFSAVEMTVVILFGMAVIGQISADSPIKGIFAGFLGVMLATTGIDPIWGRYRSTFGIMWLYEGIPVIPAIIGLLAVSELLRVINKKSIVVEEGQMREIGIKGAIEGFVMAVKRPIDVVRSTIIGVFIGAIPGAGASIASFISYQQTSAFASKEKRQQLGKGIPEGIIASEASNNGSVGGALIPLLTLGIPGSGSTAVMLTVMAFQGLVVGPRLFVNNGDIAYAILWGQLAAVNLLIFIALALISVAYKVVLVEPKVLIPIVSVLALIGAFAPRQYTFDMGLVLFLGILGYLMKHYNYPPQATLLGIILGPMLEGELFRGIRIGMGDWTIFFTRPIALVLWILLLTSIIGPSLIKLRSRKKSGISI